MKRYGMVIRIKPERLAEYKKLHANVWPEVLDRIQKSNIGNYSIYLREPENLLFSHFEYHGNNFDADMAAMAADPVTQRWWAVCIPCQSPFESRNQGDHWASMEEVFHFE